MNFLFLPLLYNILNSLTTPEIKGCGAEITIIMRMVYGGSEIQL